MTRRLLRWAVQGGLMACFVLAVYLVGVVRAGEALGTGNRPHMGLSIISTTLIAIAFRPLARRAGRLAGRIVYGERAEPYEILSDMSHRLGQSTSVDAILPRIAEVLGLGTGATGAYVWTRRGNELVPSAVWPESNADPRPIPLSNGTVPPTINGIDAVEAITDRGELLGAMGMSTESSFTPAARRLLVDAASQVGLLVRNAGLQAELEARVAEVDLLASQLRDSRRRIVETQDAERRALERNIHDGAQQFLIGLGVKVALAKKLVGSDQKRAQVALKDVRDLASQTRDALRKLSRGLYPRELTEEGIVPAVRTATSALPFSVDVVGDDARYPPDVEAAVYFCCIEAIQNAAKHARPSTVRIQISSSPGDLAFEVMDDGVGFDLSVTKGSGLRNLGDRIGALGGTIAIESSPGHGTRVTGSVPGGRTR